MTTLLTRYAALPRLTSPFFLVAAFLARLPVSMSQIGLVVLVSTSTGSIGAGGFAAGFQAAGAAVGGPFVGQWADRIGQRPVLLVACLSNAVLTLAAVWAVLSGQPMALICLLAAASGATFPQIGSLIRARWVALTAGDGRLRYAMSYEGAADETAYVLGPAAVSLMAALFDPAAAVITAALLVGVFGTYVALHPSASVSVPDHGPQTSAARLLLRPEVMLVVAGALCIGLFFGGMQTGVTAVATAAGAAGAAGGLYAVQGIGSALAGLGSAALPARFGMNQRFIVFAAGAALCVVPLLLVDGVVGTLAVMLVLGLFVGPYLITLYSLGEQQVPPNRVAVVMTLLSSGLVVGYAIGAAVGGSLADNHAPAAAFAVSLVAMSAATLVATLLRKLQHAR